MNKTVHITNSWHATSGGIRTFYRALAEYAEAHGRPMRLIVPGEDARTERWGEHVHVYHIRARPSFIGDRRYRILWPFGSTGRAVRRILAAERPDLVEIADKFTLPIIGTLLRVSAVHGAGRPVVLGASHERAQDTILTYVKEGWMGRWLARTFMRRYYWLMFDHHVANSEFTAAELVEAASGARRVQRTLHVLPMGVAADGLDPANRTPQARSALVARVGINERCRLLVYAGRLASEKNVPLLLSTLERLPESCHLLIAGDGPLRPWIMRQSELRTPGRVHLLGHLGNRSELAALHAGADVFVHPNSREPFGIAPLEAMAAGVPVVLPRAGGVLSYATDANSWLVEPEPAAFASAVQSVFAEDAVRTARTEAARMSALELSWPSVAARYFALYDELAATPSPVARFALRRPQTVSSAALHGENS